MIAPEAATSSQTRMRTQTRRTGAGDALNRRSAVGMAYAFRLSRATILKAPVRDLVLGIATVILLFVVGVQTKLLVLSHDEVKSNAPPIAARGDQSSDGPQPVAAPSAPVIAANPASVKAATVAPSVKASRSPAPRPTKQVVVPLSTVELAVRHQFKDATLFVWVDGKLALTKELHGGTQKRLVVFTGVRGSQSETLQVPAGRHALRVRAQTTDQTVDLSKTISADLVGGGDRTLAVSFDKHNTAMLLAWQ